MFLPAEKAVPKLTWNPEVEPASGSPADTGTDVVGIDKAAAGTEFDVLIEGALAFF